MTRSTSAFVLTCLVAVGAGASPALPGAARGRLAPHLAAQWEAGATSFAVIVHLAAPPEALLPMSPRGVEQPRARLEAVRETTTRTLGELVGGLAADDLVVGQVFRLRPALAATVTRAGLERLLAHPAVRFVEEDVVWHADTRQGIAMIHADTLHNLGYTGAGGAVAIIDSGVDYTHPALGGGPIPNGKVLYGKDTADHDNDPMDCGTHGTAVASIAAGSGWSMFTYVGGVAPGAGILAYKASATASCGTFYLSSVVAAIEDAVLQRDRYGVVAINLSLGGDTSDGPCDSSGAAYVSAVDDANQAGIAVVAAAGNDAAKGALASPGCLTNAISVGAVYSDDGATEQPVQYCANASCSQILCTDYHLPAKTVTCYSNSNPYLDVFAPSEQVLAAAPGHTVAAFGGTSGATPFVTGAIALLFQAIPDLTPARARLLLGITGEPITDPGNGVTRPLVDLSAALAGTGVGVGEQTGVPIPNATGVPATSSAVISDSGNVRAVQVMVKIAHPDPQQLLVTLTGPDGTRVVLHDHTAGTTPHPNGSDAIDSLYVTYPVDRAPAQSLDAFVGHPAQGSWTLEVLDDNPAMSVELTPELVGWALEVETGTTPQVSFAVPVVVHQAGASGTFWVSDVRVLNPGTAAATIHLYLVPAGVDGTVGAVESDLEVGPATVADLADVVANRFGAGEVQGNLLFGTTATGLVVTSRTYNTGSGHGTYGQFIGRADPASAIGAGDPPLYLIQLENSSGFRTNVGFSEVAAASATATVTLFDGSSGATLGSPHAFTVQPLSNLQVNRAFTELGAGSSDNAFATVEVTGGGRLVAYASVVDNVTGDAIFVPGAHPQTLASVMVPVVARAPGQAGTNWVSDVRVFNGGTSSVTVDLEYRPKQGASGAALTASTTVGASRVLAADDALSSVFGLTTGSGSLRIAPQGGAATLLVTSRTYNQTANGTYGQFIAGVTAGHSGVAYLSHLDKSDAFRSNVGFCEVGGGSVQLRYTLRGSSGAALGSDTVSLDPYQVRQVDDVYAAVGAAAATNCWVEVTVEGGEGAYQAYASVVDNLSGDAIFIPASE